MPTGKFISVEGLDGAGKSTQLEAIRQWCALNNITAQFSREPGGTPIGERLRELLLGQGGDEGFGDLAELLIVFAARAEHVETVIRPALADGVWVVSDRFTDASFAYQGARGIAMERISELEQWLLGDFKPDLTLLYDLPVDVGLERVDARGESDRFEKTSIAFKQQVRANYLLRAKNEPERIKLIDASPALAEVTAASRSVLDAFYHSL